MRTPLVAGNWKMNGTQSMALALTSGIVEGVAGKNGCDVVLCPPFVYLATVGGALGAGVGLGGQNVSEREAGAFTGEVAAEMLADSGCTHVIVGHSERRALYGESDELVADKFARAQSAGLIPILCVGETREERGDDETESVVGRQLDAVVDACGVEALAEAVVAYEPVWAIGTGLTATPEQAQSVHRFIRDRVAARSREIAAALRILYGGSVKAENAAGLFRMDDIDGGLVGGAALDASGFVQICAAARG